MKAPGLLLLLMTFWWFIPFFILALLNYSIGQHLKSFIPYFLIFSITILVSMLLSTLGFFQKWWKTSSRTKKYFLMCGAYAANGFFIGFLISYLRDRRVVEYFGADPEGSILMGFVPTIFGYFLIGLGFVFVSDWAKFFYYRRKGSKGPKATESIPGDSSRQDTLHHLRDYDHPKGMVIGALIGFPVGFLVGLLINPPFPGMTTTPSDVQGLVYFSWFALGMLGLIVGAVVGILDFRRLLSKR